MKSLDASLNDEGSEVEGPLLEIRDLKVTFQTPHGDFDAVRDAHLSIMSGETVAMVGESGSGKSTTALAVIGLLPDNGRVSGGQILLNGEDIAHASERRMIELRGKTIGMVPQDPMSNLNPVWKIGYQVSEALRANGKPARHSDVARVLEEAGLPDPGRCARQYPHQLSGGMRQRVLIAIGLSYPPRLLIADEPTSALDVTVQRQVLDHLEVMTSELGTGTLLITHDLGLAAERASRVVVMYGGRVVESGPSLELLLNPRHPYTQRLVASAPSLSSRRIQTRTRSAFTGEACPRRSRPRRSSGADELLKVENLTKKFKLRSATGRSTPFTAVDNVSFSVGRGTTTAIVGVSGSGKSTIARMVLNLLTPTSGRIVFDGVDTSTLSNRQIFDFRRRMQPIFQNPYGSLDPMYNIYRTIEEPLRTHRIGDRSSREKKVRELLDQVSLPQSSMKRYPNELSGGQRQRVAIARALALDPDVIICDEAVSALDALVQAQVLTLLGQLQSILGLTYVFIAHDLAVVRQIADDVCVMEKGKVVEAGPTDSVFEAPRHDCTTALLNAIPGTGLLPPQVGRSVLTNGVDIAKCSHRPRACRSWK
ncbi:ABC transporter ATP-binding protein [Arthrobacter sp. ISL-28]|uniref:dipeptide ABC transporter ATP-binding protein n=1 Tax=Arthrobacter sp. ISL-28 TaxID=2819108 RepID=UPI001BE6D54E|nr:ABC transporter ATP-binding protein [Arthrobacter sp. ISL-28]MBT2520041.1 ABC transporter ATP-binding protein [Arthrobacter sp. ISL-28]